MQPKVNATNLPPRTICTPIFAQLHPSLNQTSSRPPTVCVPPAASLPPHAATRGPGRHVALAGPPPERGPHRGAAHGVHPAVRAVPAQVCRALLPFVGPGFWGFGLAQSRPGYWISVGFIWGRGSDPPSEGVQELGPFSPGLLRRKTDFFQHLFLSIWFKKSPDIEILGIFKDLKNGQMVCF